MSLQDPVGDFITSIRNAQKAGKKYLQIASSKIKIGISSVLKAEGYIRDYSVNDENGKPVLTVILKYHQQKPVIEYIKRISKPSCQVYSEASKLPVVLNGLGIAIVTTSKGIMTAASASKLGIGGEVLCTVY